MDAHSPQRAILENRQELQPIPSNIEPVIKPMDGIRAVIFDIYGTLVISGSGDVGSDMKADPSSALDDAISVVGIDLEPVSIDGLFELIRETNDRVTNELMPKPEVDIVDIWKRLLVRWNVNDVEVQTVIRLAAEYESRANPTWPMPGAGQLLERLSDTEIHLGIVSNAQCFTQTLVEDLCDGRADCFDPNLCFFSYRYRQAKPAPRMFECLCDVLSRYSVDPEQTIYVGNDMLNDMWAASQFGLKTAWYVGDQRSVRERAEDARCQRFKPDLVFTDLLQLLPCLGIG